MHVQVFKMKKQLTKKLETTKKKFVVHKYSVIQFDEEEPEEKLFECIPDLWFVDENRKSCRFPPITGKSYIQRAINCEMPEDHWGIDDCTVISGGHCNIVGKYPFKIVYVIKFLTYHAGFKVVKEKCSQRYNTSSADEAIQAAQYLRDHPGLIGEGIEHIFEKPQLAANGTMNIDELSDGKCSA